MDINTEFNTIYNHTNQKDKMKQITIIIATDGIWGIDMENMETIKELNYSNMLFNSRLNNFKNVFDNYYTKQKYENRKLKWVDNLSTCNIDYTINGLKLSLDNCCLKQANLLYNYNTNDFIEADSCSEYELQTLKMFSKLKILKKNKQNNRFILNMDYNNNNNITNKTNGSGKYNSEHNNKLNFNIKSIFSKYKKYLLNK